MDAQIVERSQRGLQASLEHMPLVIDKIRYQGKSFNPSACYESLSGDHICLGVFDYFIEGNKQTFKQHFHVAIQLKLAAIALYDYQRFTVGEEILYALLSDNPALIDTIAKLAPPYFVEGRSNPLHSEFLVHMYQLAIQGDDEALQAKVERLAKNGRKKDRELPAQGKDFFSLLMRGDKRGLEDLIGQHARVKAQKALFEDFMCFQGTIEAKICWLRGIQVQIDSPLLPMALMPIEPLAHYDDVYDFLAPDYVPPKVGLWGRLRYWYQERARKKAMFKAAIDGSRKSLL